MNQLMCFSDGQRYLSNIIEQYPVLSHEEEVALYRDYLSGSLHSMQKLIMHNIRYVLSVVNEFKTYGFDEYELMQEGVIGLMKALKNYDPDSGFKVITFCTHQIRSRIQMYIMKNRDIVSLTDSKYNKKLYYGFNKAWSEYEKNNPSGLDYPSQKAIDFICEKLDVPSSKAVRFYLQSKHAVSLDEKTEDEMDLHEVISDGVTLEDFLIDQCEVTPNDLMKGLTEREKQIITWRYLIDEPKSLKEIATYYGVSHQAIHISEKSAINKIKRSIEEK